MVSATSGWLEVQASSLRPSTLWTRVCPRKKFLQGQSPLVVLSLKNNAMVDPLLLDDVTSNGVPILSKMLPVFEDDGLLVARGHTKIAHIVPDVLTNLFTSSPTLSPTIAPTSSPTLPPTPSPTFTDFVTNDGADKFAYIVPTSAPIFSPSLSPTMVPTSSPILSPTSTPTSSPLHRPCYQQSVKKKQRQKSVRQKDLDPKSVSAQGPSHRNQREGGTS